MEGQGDPNGRGVTRRGFVASLGAGAVAATVAGGTAATACAAEVAADEMLPVTLSINGRVHKLLVEPRWTLLDVLRDRIGLTGTKVGCERGECGACTVLLGDVPHYACMILAVEAQGLPITTVEGLMEGEELGPLQQAFAEEDAFQCGYCTPGQIMAAEGLLRANPSPTLHQIQTGMSGNLCRCGAYVHIFNAVDREAKRRGGSGGQS